VGGVFGSGVVVWMVVVIGWDATFIIGGVLALTAGGVGFLLRPPELTSTRGELLGTN